MHDSTRQRLAETALLQIITAADLRRNLRDPSLCHGLTGLLHITRRATADSGDTTLARHLTALRETIDTDDHVVHAATRSATSLGLLDGAPGIALALDTDHPAGPGWDTCLLTS